MNEIIASAKKLIPNLPMGAAITEFAACVPFPAPVTSYSVLPKRLKACTMLPVCNLPV